MDGAPGDGRKHPLFFITRPFGSMFGPTGGLFGPVGFLAMDIHRFLGDRTGPLIEELPDVHESLETSFKQSQQAIVEYPDDEVVSGITGQVGSQLRNGNSSLSPSTSTHEANNGHHSFNSSVTYVRTGEFHCSLYSMGLDGVMTEEHVEKDASGKRARLTARGLCDEVHTITEKQNATDSIMATLTPV